MSITLTDLYSVVLFIIHINIIISKFIVGYGQAKKAHDYNSEADLTSFPSVNLIFFINSLKYYG